MKESLTAYEEASLRQNADAAVRRYQHYCAAATPELGDFRSPGNIEAHLRLETHRVEKGMSISSPRRPYGQLSKQRLEGLLVLARRLSSKSPALLRAESQAREAIEALDSWNSEIGDDAPRNTTITQPYSSCKRQSLDHWRDPDALYHDPYSAEFFLRRSSIRSFDPQRMVNAKSLELAARIARSSPSVCNRAAGRVHFYQGVEKISPILAMQKGNRGLTGMRHLAVVTAELSLFAGAQEFFQPWVDGGLFLMNLVWGFHLQDIGTCLLNWSMPEEASCELRALCDIPDSELVVCLLAFGYVQEGAHVTRSAHPPIEAVMQVH